MQFEVHIHLTKFPKMLLSQNGVRNRGRVYFFPKMKLQSTLLRNKHKIRAILLRAHKLNFFSPRHVIPVLKAEVYVPETSTARASNNKKWQLLAPRWVRQSNRPVGLYKKDHGYEVGDKTTHILLTTGDYTLPNM